MRNPLPKNWSESADQKLTGQLAHRQWLMAQADRLLEFFHNNARDPNGGFFALGNNGSPLTAGPNGQEHQLHDTTRFVHCFAVAKLFGRAGADAMVDHGMDYLWSRHRDQRNGGYYWGVDGSGASNSVKQAYGHAFVLLAASSAKVVGHPDADRLLSDISEVLLARFWDPVIGATREEFTADWQQISEYRGQNSNMHLTEALMAACEATGDTQYLKMAESIAALIVERHARAQGWRIAEHFDKNWQVDRQYVGDPVFRPKGITPGHALEWSRLLIQLWELGGRTNGWMPESAKKLFFNAVENGWDARTGGFYYTLGWDNMPDQTDRFWWPCAEGIAASAVLASVDDDPVYGMWYRRIWEFVDAHIIDHKNGGWFPELDSGLNPVNRVFSGKPDLYHALQACIIPLLSGQGSITRGLQTGMQNPHQEK